MSLVAEEALERLRRGNQRFLEDRVQQAGRDAARRRALIEGQAPFAVVLCCADSRVVPELVFDAGLGELFVVRVAGNVANTATIASIEYAMAQLGTRLLVVMGHGGCGAVTAAMAGGDAGSKNLEHLLGYIAPAVADSAGDDVDTVAMRNAQLNAERLLAESDVIRGAVTRGGVRVCPAFYRPETGAVDFLGSE